MEHKIYLSNSLTGKKEEFIPIDKKNITLYVCGPTVYHRPHIGNARSIVVYDILFRLLKYVYPKVTYVRNITDIDDKIIDAAAEKNISISDLTKNVINEYNEDLEYLNILTPTYEPKATENIKQIISLIEKLLANKFAYESDNHILFDVAKYKEYGKLSGKKIDDRISGSRVEIADYKQNPLDFILWKPSKDTDDESAKFKSPWGVGRPGWHIECSAMSMNILGNNFDIHGGGADLKFPHHENEIAQSKCANLGSKYANYWVHNGFLTVNGDKMSKSLGNFTTLKDLKDKNINGMDLKFFFLTAHYKKPLDFNEKSLNDAIKQNKKFNELLSNNIQNININSNKLPENIFKSLANDMNCLDLIRQMNDLYKLAKAGDINKLQDLYNTLNFLDVLYKEESSLTVEIPGDILKKADFIKQARVEKNYGLADKLRDEISAVGFKIEYLPNGDIKIK